MRRDTEGSLQHVVSGVLRAGVIASASVGLIAAVYDLAAHGGERVSFHPFRGTPEAERHVPSILTNALHLQPRALMMVALMLLLITPVVRVIVSLFGFIKERDRVYVVVTTVVLLTLLGSLAFGGVAE
jgi:uncharacterized membrane protein